MEHTPYIIAFITQGIAFAVWIVKSNTDFNKQIAIMETKINNLEKDVERQTQENKEVSAKLSAVSELLAVCRNVVDNISLKFMKTRSA